MKFIHTSDLHIGKQVNEFSLLEDQRFVLEQMLDLAKEEKADAFVIAGDVYDRSVPSAEAVQLLDHFLTGLSKAEIPVLMIAGNHDSPERLSFARQMLGRQGIYIAGLGQEGPGEVVLEDKEQRVTFVLLPFVRPAEADCRSCEEAVRRLLAQSCPTDGRRVLVTHYFVTSQGREPELSDSETTLHVGGIDNVDTAALEGFDYVALGHIHKPQQLGEKAIWYAGAPLAYSFSESSQNKGVNLVTLPADGGPAQVKRCLLKPLHAMRRVKGRLEELLIQGEGLRQREDPARLDYLQAVLTDELELLDPMNSLRSVYPNVMQIVLAARQKEQPQGFEARQVQTARRSVTEVFADFYAFVKGEELDSGKRRMAEEIGRRLE